jgi:hypothetical protein
MRSSSSLRGAQTFAPADSEALPVCTKERQGERQQGHQRRPRKHECSQQKHQRGEQEQHVVNRKCREPRNKREMLTAAQVSTFEPALICGRRITGGVPAAQSLLTRRLALSPQRLRLHGRALHLRRDCRCYSDPTRDQRLLKRVSIASIRAGPVAPLGYLVSFGAETLYRSSVNHSVSATLLCIGRCSPRDRSNVQ